MNHGWFCAIFFVCFDIDVLIIVRCLDDLVITKYMV